MLSKKSIGKFYFFVLYICSAACSSHRYDSPEGYYETFITSKEEAKTVVGMELKSDSLALFSTDYNNLAPEIVLKGKWYRDTVDASKVVVNFNNEIMKFKWTGDELRLYENMRYGRKGLEKLNLDRADRPADTAKNLVVWIAPELTPCYNGTDQKCYRARWGDADRGNYFRFADTIKNFQYQEGLNYKLKVVRRPKTTEKEDSVAYAYELKEIMLKRSSTAMQ